jgi:hypothetical protein
MSWTMTAPLPMTAAGLTRMTAIQVTAIQVTAAQVTAARVTAARVTAARVTAAQATAESSRTTTVAHRVIRMQTGRGGSNRETRMPRRTPAIEMMPMTMIRVGKFRT